MGAALVEKHTKDEYNENQYLDKYILDSIKGSEILADDIVIVDGWAFELDRSVPKIGRGLGKKDELVFPEISLNKLIPENALSATIILNAKEEKNGINKVEIIQDETILKEFTYDNEKEININYEVKQNGNYIVKVYSNLSSKKSIEIDEIRTQVKFIPNGNVEYKKEQSTQIAIDNTAGNTIKELKYQWTSSAVEPAIGTFTEKCKSGDILMKNEGTGIYYLWVLTELSSGKTFIDKSEGFYLDNTGPVISELTVTSSSATEIILKATAQDTGSGLTKIDFYVDNVLKSSQTIMATRSNITKTVTISGLTTGNHNCYAIAYDALENPSTKKTASGSTKLYTWDRYNVISTTTYTEKQSSSSITVNPSSSAGYHTTSAPDKDFKNGQYISKGIGYSGSSYYEYAAHGASYKVSGKSYNKTSGYRYISSSSMTINIITYTMVGNTTYSKGNANGTVTGTSSSAYPTNGRSGSYWYVYKGIY